MKSGVYSCSIHTHSLLCDGKSSLREMAESACAAGVKHLGFSGHVHTPIPHDEGNVLPGGAEEYFALCRRLREEYRGRMEILVGLEWDSCSLEPLPEGLDYWIGSVHNLRNEGSGKYYSVDWRREDLIACRDELFGGDMLALAAAYYAEVARVAAMAPTVLGHIDLITKLNGDGSLFDEGSPAYRRLALSALERLDPARSLLEINTGAMARGYRSEPYPAPFLLEAWREMGGRVIVTSDAHSADKLLHAYDRALELARGAGYCSCAILSLGGIVDCEI